MEIVLATNGLAGIGGSETYLLTVAEQLQRLGHAVTVHAATGGAMSEFVAERGLPVAIGEREVVRLRHPVDTQRLAPRGEIRERPRRAVLLGNYVSGRHRRRQGALDPRRNGVRARGLRARRRRR